MIALDLDNTIICYDEAFRAAAAQLDCLPEPGIATNKPSIKAAALACGGNNLWTRLQSLAYGEEISKAYLFPGCAHFVATACEELVIVSHKTRFPAVGQRTDLRDAARAFLRATPLAKIPVHFLDTREAKVAKIAQLKARALIDDLPEVFKTPGFPSDSTFFLFDPNNTHADWIETPRIQSWSDASDHIWPNRK